MHKSYGIRCDACKEKLQANKDCHQFIFALSWMKMHE